MKSNNTKKTKTVMALTTVLGCVALVGVGYSSFVVLTSVLSQEGNVSVVAADITDETFQISTITVSDSNVVFGPDRNVASPAYIGYDTESDSEDLTAIFSFTITAGSNLASDSNTTYNIAISFDDYASGAAEGASRLGYFEDESGATYVEAPTDGTGITIATYSNGSLSPASAFSEGDNYDSDSGAGFGVVIDSLTITVTAKFGWGEFFNYTNPVNWSDGTAVASAQAAIQSVNSNLNGASFVFTVEASKAE